jgi:hypothetical protein
MRPCPAQHQSPYASAICLGAAVWRVQPIGLEIDAIARCNRNALEFIVGY